VTSFFRNRHPLESYFFVSVLIALLMAALGLLLFGSPGNDDAYITFWPAHTFAQFGEVLNYNGERLEQSSSLLHVLLLGGTSVVTGLEPHEFGKLFSLLFGLIAIPLTALFAERCKPGTGIAAALLAALTIPLMYWSMGGLETSLVACVGIGVAMSAARFFEKGSILPFALAGLAWLLVRPESPFTLLFAIGLFWFGSRDKERRSAVQLGVMVIALAAAIALFRYNYFGSILPQPALAKGEVGLDRFTAGARYLYYSLPWLVMAVGLPALWKQGAIGRFGASLALANLAFCFASGGDWMLGGRFLAHTMPMMATGVALLLSKRHIAVTGLASAYLLVAAVYFTSNSSTGMPIWVEREKLAGWGWWETSSRVQVRDIPVFEELDRVVSRLALDDERITIMSSQMGFVAYHLSLRHYGKIQILDRLSLATNTLLKNPEFQDGRKTAAGYDVPYEFIFERDHALENEIGPGGPEIIFDLLEPTWGDDGRYKMLYWQDSMIWNPPPLRGQLFPYSEYIAVRSDLARKFGLGPQRLIAWPGGPPGYLIGPRTAETTKPEGAVRTR
jgi:hypothetical protein